ncbi:MAG: hypothetical protein LBL31_06225, partial [Spirochaetaceae bacterium]|nr:hypothetical protein [Spirochaetaceae bacterium]
MNRFSNMAMKYLRAESGEGSCGNNAAGLSLQALRSGQYVRASFWRLGTVAVAVIFFIFAAAFAAAQEELPPEEPLLSEAPLLLEEPFLPDEPSLPEEPPEPDDIDYLEPAEEADFVETVYTRPPRRGTLWERIRAALYRHLAAPATTRHREPLRSFDWGLLAGNAEVANTLIGAQDILQETIKINGADLAARSDEQGFLLNTGFMFQSALDFNGRTEGFGFFTTMDGRVDLGIPDTLLSLFAYGNTGSSSMSGSLTVSGAIFADIGFHRYFAIGDWRVDIKPAWFLPLVYVPQSDISFVFDTEDHITIGAFGTTTAYLPVNMNESGIGMLNNIGGLDFSVSAEYPLFPILDVGAGLSHVPFMPARLSNKVRASIDEQILDNASILDILRDPSLLHLTFSPDYSLSSAEIYVLRPLSLNTWLLYRPFRTDLLTIKPNIGFTAITPSGEAYFNAGLALELNVARILFLRASSGLEDGIWQHKAGFGLNLRVIQLDIEAAIASQKYLSA